MEPKSVLKDLLNVFEREFPEAEVFKPRQIRLEEFAYINDEEIDKADELEQDETVILGERVDERRMAVDLPEIAKLAPISAVDSGSVQLGETDQGIVSAVRCSVIVSLSTATPRVERYGPYVIHITEENRQSIYDYFRTKIFGMGRAEAPRLRKMTDRIRNFIERLAQQYAASVIENGITLWDGSLTGGTIDTPRNTLRGSLSIAKAKGNGVVAVSKSSWLKLVTGEKLIDLLERVSIPCYMDVHDKIQTGWARRFLGRIHVVKFTPDGFTFRVDVFPRGGRSCRETLGLLSYNCEFYNGYPEPLREAHINSYFTPNEILALQTYAVDKYGLEVIRSFDVRKCILAPF